MNQRQRRNMIRSLLIVIGLALILSFITGCSATKKIAAEATKVQVAATDIRSEVVSAKQDLKAGDTVKVGKHLDTIDGKAVEIQEAVVEVQKALPDVQDRTPWWAPLIKWALITIASLAFVFVLWRLNLFFVLEHGIQWLVTLVAKIGGKIAGA